MRGQYGGYVMEGGRKARSKSKKARKPRSVKTDLCHQARNAPGRCHLSPHGSALHTKYNASAAQLANQDRFVAASAAARADGHAPGTREFGAAFRAAYHGQGAASPRASGRAASPRASGRGAQGAHAKRRATAASAADAKRAARAANRAYRSSPQATADQEAALWESGRGHSRKKGSKQLRRGGARGSDGNPYNGQYYR